VRPPIGSRARQRKVVRRSCRKPCMISSPAVKLGIRRPVGLAQWVALAVGGLFAVWIFTVSLLMVLAETPSPFPVTEITKQKPYADFVGRECRVVADVRATAWNDFPDKAKILEISLMPPPGVKNRFVSYVTPLKPDQRVRIVSAWQQFGLVGFNRHYVVSVPDAGLPDGIPITMYMNADGVPDPRVCEPMNK
jgi:hypothetical protein